MTTTIDEVCEFLELFAPSRLAEQWDNVGLLVGDRAQPVRKLMTCLTITPDSAAEAAEERVDLIVSHHPLPFHALKRLTTDSTPGRLLWKLIGNGIAVHSPHTAFDSAATGINQSLAEGLELLDITPLVPLDDDPQDLGAARQGRLAKTESLADFARRVKRFFLGIAGMHAVGAEDRAIERVAVACGAAGPFLTAAVEAGCDVLVTGETSFHTALEAQASDVGLLLPGHYASERFAVERLANVLSQEFPSLSVWASRREADPLRWVP